MFRNFLNRRVSKQQSRNLKKRTRQARRGGFRSEMARLQPERLEDRIVLATLTWTGDVDNLWNSGTDGVDTNWDTNMLPQDGDTLVFPTGAANQTNTNDTTGGNSYTLEFTGGTYTISGNQITLDNAGTDIVRSGGGAHVLGTPLALDASSTIEVSPVAGFLQLNSPLTVGNLIKTGPGDLLLVSASTYPGTTDVQDGRLQVELGGSINSAATVTVQSGALLATSSTGSVNAPVDGQAGSGIQTFFAGTMLSLGDGTGSGFVTDGTLTVVDNSTITLVDSNAAELGSDTLLGGAGATLNAANGVSLSGGDVLRGTGTVNGAVAINDGTLSPGTGGIGSIATGALSFGAGGAYNVQLNGATAGNFDQVNVTGAINLGGATLSLSGPYVASAADPPIPILTETAGVTGTFAGLPEGATILLNNAPLTISYCVSVANEVTLDYDSTPTIAGTAGADDFDLSLSAGVLELRRGGVLILSTPVGDLTDLTIDGGDGNDTLTVDFSGGDPIPTGGLFFNGQGQTGAPGDSIVITGGAWTNNTYDFTNANDGSIDLDGSLITYTGLEPLTNTGTAANIVFNLPNVANPDATLQDSANAGESELVGSTFEDTIFTNPTSSLMINGGTMADTISVEGLDPGFDANLNIAATAAGGSVTFQTNPTDIGTGAFDISAGDISVDAAISTEGLVILIASGAEGDVDVDANITKTGGADTMLVIRADGDIIFDSSADVASAGGEFAVTLNSDRNAAGGGGIRLNPGTNINSNGGDIVLGGGADPLNTPAQGTAATADDGVRIDSAQLIAAGGDISVRGSGPDDGIETIFSAAIQTSGGGSITIDGISTAAAGDFRHGVVMSGTTQVTTVDGNIAIAGQGGNTAGNGAIGVSLAQTSLVSTIGTGSISVNGTGGNTTSSPGVSVASGVSATGSGNVMLTGTGGAGNNDGVVIGGSVSATSGALAVNGEGTGSGDGIQLDVNGTISSGTGPVDLISEDDVDFSFFSSITSTSGDVTIIADNAGGNNGGGVNMADLTSIDAGSGVVGIFADGNVGISSITTNTAADPSVSVSTTSGAIIDNLGGEAANVTGGQIVLRAATGIGSAGDIETSTSTLAASNSTSGDINITNSVGGLLTIGTVDGLAGITNNGGSVTVVNASPLTVAADVTATGDVTLTATDSAAPGDDLTVNAGVTVSSTGGNVVLNAGDDLLLSPTALVSAIAGAITINVDNPGGADDDPGVGSTVTLSDSTNLVSANGTTMASGVDNDVFNIVPQVASTIFIDGNAPGFGDPGVPPGDTLNLDVTGLTSTLDLIPTDGGFVGTLSSAVDDVSFVNIETITSLNGLVDVQVRLDLSTDAVLTNPPFNLPAGSGFGDDGAPDDVSVQVTADGLQLIVSDGVDTAEILPLAASVNSLTVVGSSDDDSLILNETMLGLPNFPGQSPAAQTNPAFNASGIQPAAGNIGLAFDGGGGVDDIQATFTTTQNVAYFSHDGSTSIPGGAVPNAGVLSIMGQLTMSFEGLAPMALFGAGGSLLMDATATPATTMLSIDDDFFAPGPVAVPAAPGNGVTAVYGDGGWETVQFTGFADVTVRGGAGSETIDLIAIDNAVAPGNLITDIILDGDDTLNTDASDDLILVQTLPMGVTATLMAGPDTGAGGGDLYELNNFITRPRGGEVINPAPAGALDDVLGDVNVQPNGSPSLAFPAPEEGGFERLTVFDSNDANGDTIQITGTTIDGITGEPPVPPTAITYNTNTVGSNLVGGVDVIENVDIVSSDQAIDTFNILSSQLGSTYFIDTGIFGAFDDVVNISSTAPSLAGNLNGIDGQLNFSFPPAQPGTTLNVSDFGDTAGDTYDLIANGGTTELYFTDGGAMVGNAGLLGIPDVTYDTVALFQLIGSNDLAAANNYNIYDTTATVSTTINDGDVSNPGPGNNGTFNIQADAVQPGSANVFSGFDGNDNFEVYFASDAAIPGAAGTTFQIDGGALSTDPENRDEVELNVGGTITSPGAGMPPIVAVTPDTVARNLNFTYANPSGNDVDITGLGTDPGAPNNGVLDINNVETLFHNGTGPGDAVQVTGTIADDDLTVALLNNNSSALVFRDGNPYIEAPPESIAGFLPGLAGGGFGPDMRINGVGASGILLDGGGNDGVPGTGDRAIVQAASEMNIVTGGALDIFGFGPGILIPGFGGGDAYDTIDFNNSVPNQVSVVNNAFGPLLPVTIVPMSFVQNGPPALDQRPAFIVNGGDEAMAQGNGISDNFTAAPSMLFNLQANGNLPGLVLGPDGLPIGDQLNLTSPTSINVFSDKSTPPNVTVTFGTNIFGVRDSGIERQLLTPGNGQLNLLGDNGNAPGSDQTDNFVVVGRDINGNGDGVEEGTLEINGSTPRLFQMVDDLNVFGFELIDTLEITPYADDTPRGWGIDVFYDEGPPVQGDGQQLDLLIVHTSLFGGQVSEDIVIRPSGADNGEVVITNGSFGTPIVDIDYVNNTDIIVLDDDGFLNDTDTLTLLGSNPDNAGTSGNEFVEADFTQAGGVGSPQVTVTDLDPVMPGAAILYRLRDFQGFDTIDISTLAGDDVVAVRNRPGLTVNADLGLPLASDTLHVAVDADVTVTPGDDPHAGVIEQATAGPINYVDAESVTVDTDSPNGVLTVRGTNGNDNIALQGVGSSTGLQNQGTVSLNNGSVISFNNAISLTSSLSGTQENPPNASPAFGSASFTYDPTTGLFDMNVFIDGLTAGDIVGFHIHQAPFGVNGPVVVGFINPNTTGMAPAFVDEPGGTRMVLNGVTLPGAVEADFLAGNTYLNVHTPAFPGGEVRGQITGVTSTGTFTEVEIEGGLGDDQFQAFQPVDGWAVTDVSFDGDSGVDSLSLIGTSVDDSFLYDAPNSTIAATTNGLTTNYGFTSVEEAAVDGMGHAGGDDLTVLAPTVTFTPGPGNGEGTLAPFDGAGSPLTPLSFANIETIDVNGTGIATILGTQDDDVIFLDANGIVMVSNSLGTTTIDLNGYVAAVIDASGGDDLVQIAGDHPLISGVTVLGGDNGTATDTLFFLGAGGPVTLDLSVPSIAQAGFGGVFYSGIEEVTVDANSTLAVNATAGDDVINVTPLTASNSGTFDHNLTPNVVFDYTDATTVTFGGGVAGFDRLNVLGDAGPDTVTSTATTVTVDGSTVTLGAGLDYLGVITFEGDDNVDLDGLTIDATVDAGAGNDLVDASGVANDNVQLLLLGGDGDDNLIGGDSPNGAALGDRLEGGPGNDRLEGGRGQDFFFGGDGNDQLVWVAGDGSDLMEGGAGDSDVMLFVAGGGDNRLELFGGGLFGATGVNPAPNVFGPGTLQNGSRSIFALNSAGQDLAAVFLNMGDVEDIFIDAGAGADQIAINNQANTAFTSGAALQQGTDLAFTTIRSVEIDLSAADGATDAVEVYGNTTADHVVVSNQGGEVDVAGFSYGIRAANTEQALDDLFVHGQEGDDTIEALDGVETLVMLTFNGNDGNDTLIGSPLDDMLNGGDGDDRIDGRGGVNDVDGGAGTDTILVRGTAGADTISTTHGAGIFMITGGLSAGVNNITDMEAVHVAAGGGADTIDLTLLAAGGLNYTVAGGDPVGAVGDTLNVITPAAVTVTPGPQSDEGSIDVATGTPTSISYDGIEALSVTSMPGGGTLTVNGTTDDDEITIIGTGMEAFTVSVNAGPAVQYTGFSTLNVNSMAGDDDITLDVEDPNLGVAFVIDGGLPTGGSDQLRVTGVLGQDDMPNWTPDDADGGMLALAGLPPIMVNGIEHLLYDGESDGEMLTLTGTTEDDEILHEPGDLADNGRLDINDGTTQLLGIAYENLGVVGSVNVDGGGAVGSGDFLTILGTAGSDFMQIAFTAADAISVELVDDAFTHVTVASTNVANYFVNARESEDTVEVNAPVQASGDFTVAGGDPGTGDVLTIFDEIGVDNDMTLSPDAAFSDVQVIDGIGTVPATLFAFEFIEFFGTPGDGDSLTVNLGPGDNTARVERGNIGDRVTSNAFLDIVTEFTGMDEFTVVGQAGNDVVTFATWFLAGATPGNYAFNGGGTDTLVIEGADGANNGNDDFTVTNPLNGPVAVTDNNGTGVTVTATNAMQGRLQLNTLGGDDVVTVDQSGGLIAPLITYDGGSGSDVLNVTGTTLVNNATYSPGPAVGEGRLTYDSMTIDFAGLEPIHDNVSAATVTINGTNSDNAINYSAGPGGGIFVGPTGLVSVDGFETYEFNNKDSLVINALAGDDLVNLNNPTGFTSAGGVQSITVNGDDPTASDTVIVNGTTGADTITFTPSAITPDSAVLTGVQNVPMVTVNTSEHLTINGLGGNDTLNVVAPDMDDVEFTPDLFEDAGSIAISSDQFGPFQRRLPMDFLNLGANGVINVNSAGGGRNLLLRINGTPDDDIITVGTNDVVQIFKRTANFIVTLPIQTPGVQLLALDGANGDDDFNIPLNHPYSFGGGGIHIEGGNPGSGSDTLFATGSGANPVTVDLGASTVTETTFTPVTYTGIETIELDTNGAAPTVRATSVDDDLTVTVYDENSGRVQHGYAVQQNGQVAPDVTAPLVNYSDIAGSAINFDLAGGQDTLVVVGSSFTGTGGTFDQRFDVDVLTSTVSIDDDDDGTNQGLVTYTNNESLAVFGLEGDDVFRVTPGAIPVFIAGGDPIGETAGDQVDIVAGGQAVVFETGPENDEGGFIVGAQERISFDHIEALGVLGAAKAIITGTNDDDEITIIARTEQAVPPAFIGADGVQDFTTSVNSSPEILWLDTPLIFVDGKSGDDDITIRTPAPNNADWNVDVFVAGGAPSQQAVGDRLRVETPFRDDTIQYQPTGPDSGIMSIFNAAGGAIDSVIYIGQWEVDCDGDQIVDYVSSPGGVEQLLYDGVSAEGSFDHDVITGVTTQNSAVPSNDNLTILGNGFSQVTSDDRFIHTPGASPDAGGVAVVDQTNNQTMLGVTYTNIGLDGTITVDGLTGNDTLVALGTGDSDRVEVGFTGSDAIDVDLASAAGVHVDLRSANVQSYEVRTLEGDDDITIVGRVQATGTFAVFGSGPSAGSDTLGLDATADPADNDVQIEPDHVNPDDQNITGLGALIDVTGIELINLIGSPAQNDSLTVLLGEGDNVARVERGTDIFGVDADQVTSDSLPAIGFAGLDDFAVDGQTGNDSATFVTWHLVGATAGNYAFRDVGSATDSLIIEGSDGSTTTGDDRFTVTSPAGNVAVTDGNGNNVTVTGMGVGRLEINTLGGDDWVTVDAGSPDVIGVPITFNGGANSDLLRVTGNPATAVQTETYSPGPAVGEGRLTYDSAAGSRLMTIDFTGLEPVFTDLVVNGNLVVNGTNADNAINYMAGPDSGIVNAVNPNGLVTGLVTVDGFEGLQFGDKANLVINGLAGDDVVNLNHPSNPTGTVNNLTSITVNGDDPTASDTVIVNNTNSGVDIDFTPDSGGTGDVDQALIVGAQFVPVTADTVELVVINGLSNNDTLDVNTPAATSSTITVTPGATIDSGDVQVDRLVPLHFTNLGATARLTVTDPGVIENDTLIYNGTDHADTFSVPFTGGATDTSIGLNQQIEVDTINVENYTLRGAGGDDFFQITPPSSRNIPITVEGAEPGSDLIDFIVNSTPAAPRSVVFHYDNTALTPDPNLQTIQQDALGIVTLLGVETANIIGTANADVEDLTIQGTRVDDTTTYTPLSTHRGTVSNDREATVVNFENFDQGEDDFAITGGGGFADRVVVNGTNGRDLIQVDSTTRTVTPIVLPFAFPSGPGTANPGTTWRDVVLDDINATPAGSLVDTLTINGSDGDDTFHVVPGLTGNGATLFVNVDGGQPQASDALVITNLNANGTAASLAATDFVVIGHSRIPDAGNIITYQSAVRRPNIAYTNVEVVSANVNPVAAPGLNPNLLILGPDNYEQNEFQGTAAFLGSGDALNIDNLAIFPDANEHPGVPADTDYFQVVAETTGTLDFQVFFRVFDPNLLPAGGQLGINVLDKAGNVIGGAGTFGNPDGTADARVRIPAIEGQEYFLHVFGANADGTFNTNVVNGYDMTIVNHAPPVPFDLELYDIPIGVGTNPPGGTANSDTGRSRFDNITFDNTPTIAFRLDDAIFLQDLPGNSTPDTPPDEVIPIPFRAGPNQPTMAGYAIAIFDEGATSPPAPGNAGGLEVQEPLGFATMIEPGLYTFTTPVLNDGSHFLTARVQMLDPATPMQTGFGARSLSLEIIVDVVAPTITFGTAASATDGLHADSDSQDPNPLAPATRTDRITNDVTPTFWGVAEADSFIRVYVDQNGNGVVDANDVQIADTTAIPLDGGDQFPNGYWEATSFVDLNDPAFFAFDGQRNILVTAEDVAGNVSAAQQLSIFIDTQGPQVADDPFISDGVGTPVDPGFDLFALKPDNAAQGPTPLVNYITIPMRDLPARTAAFIYQAVSTGPPVGVGVAGNLPLEAVVLEGDANGVIPITSIVFIPTNNGPGIATGNIVIQFDEPLPDDRYTLRLNDENIIDPAGNQLDGENDATEPGSPTYPTGDGRPGGDFIARFTVDSRPEIGVWASGTVWVDINGNGHYDTTNVDFTNRDFVYAFGNGSSNAATGGIAFTSDDFFAGDFNGNGFDELGAYGSIGAGIVGPWRWLIDTTDDGRPDVQVTDPQNVNGLPVAGNFDAAQNAQDEVGLFTGTNGNTWWFDTDGDFLVDASVVTPQLRGFPIVGDFDGDGFDDLGGYENGVFRFLLTDGVARSWLTGNATFAQLLFDSVSGVRERPIAADMDQDGIDDIGLWMPDRAGQTPVEGAEWFFLISADPDGTNRVDGQINTLAHAFSPVPLGNDIYYQFGDAFAVPIVGNFDPPTGEGSEPLDPNPIRDQLDVNFDGAITSLDVLAVVNSLNSLGPREVGPPQPGQIVILDANRDNFVTSADARVIINFLNSVVDGEGEAGQVEPINFAAGSSPFVLGVSPAPAAPVTATGAGTAAGSSLLDQAAGDADEDWIDDLAASLASDDANVSVDPTRAELFAGVAVEDDLLADLAADVSRHNSRTSDDALEDIL